MTASERSAVTELVATLGGSAAGDARQAAADLLPVVYEELRRLARGYLSRERPDHTLQATDLVHEAYGRLVNASHVDWRGRTHFLAVGANAMRRILIDHARRKAATKRGGARLKVTLSDAMGMGCEEGLDPAELLDLDRALERLAELDERGARVVEMRFFAGLTTAEIAEVLGVSARTVQGDWAHARAWLRLHLAEAEAQ